MVRSLLRHLDGLSGHAGANRQLASGSVVSFLIQGTGAGLLFATEILLARVLGASEYGLYSTVMAWLQVLVIVVMLGGNSLLLRFVPVYIAKAEWPWLRGLLKFCIRNSIVMGIGTFAVASSLLFSLGEGIAPETRLAFLIGIATLPIAGLSLQRQSTLRGLNRIAAALIPEFVVRPVFLMLVVVLLASFMGHPVSAPQALAAYAAAILFAFLLGWYLQRRALPGEVMRAHSLSNDREWMRIAMPFFLVAGMHLLIVRMDIMLLAIFTGRESAGVYAASSRISDLVVFALSSANMILAPMIAGLHAKNDLDMLQSMLRFLMKGALLFTLPIAVLVMAFGSMILGMFGDAYLTGDTPLKILVLGQVVNALCGPVAFLLAMTGHQSAMARILGVATVLNFVLNIVLIPAHGVVGAAIATGLTTIFWNVSMLRSVRHRLGLEPSILVLLRARS